MDYLEEQLRELLLPVIKEEGVELIDLEIRGHANRLVIRVFVDYPSGGITIDKCVELSRLFLDRLDVEDVISGNYRLEVSSPGVDRPLKTIFDFSRNIGKKVRVIYFDDEVEKVIEGTILKAQQEEVQIKMAQEIKKIPVEKIRSGKILLPW
ncbi:MAG: ribosome maturation factor RimP [Calditrichaeota bacterium]|nr:MAG: ribosome maturation factor RimP [Calditrichota bacterium]